MTINVMLCPSATFTSTSSLLVLAPLGSGCYGSMCTVHFFFLIYQEYSVKIHIDILMVFKINYVVC